MLNACLGSLASGGFFRVHPVVVDLISPGGGPGTSASPRKGGRAGHFSRGLTSPLCRRGSCPGKGTHRLKGPNCRGLSGFVPGRERNPGAPGRPGRAEGLFGRKKSPFIPGGRSRQEL